MPGAELWPGVADPPAPRGPGATDPLALLSTGVWGACKRVTVRDTDSQTPVTHARNRHFNRLVG